jgi:hypothetical protein
MKAEAMCLCVLAQTGIASTFPVLKEIFRFFSAFLSAFPVSLARFGP